MQSLEDTEKLVGILHVESNTVVAHVVDDPVALTQRADIYSSRTAASGEFEGVRQEIGQYLLEKRSVSVAIGQLLDMHTHLRLALTLLQTRDDAQNDLAQRHAQTVQRFAAESREVQQIVDELVHPSRTGPDTFKQLSARLWHACFEFTAEQFAKALDRTQRLAQIVRH